MRSRLWRAGQGLRNALAAFAPELATASARPETAMTGLGVRSPTRQPDDMAHDDDGRGTCGNRCGRPRCETWTFSDTAARPANPLATNPLARPRKAPVPTIGSLCKAGSDHRVSRCSSCAPSPAPKSGDHRGAARGPWRGGRRFLQSFLGLGRGFRAAWGRGRRYRPSCRPPRSRWRHHRVRVGHQPRSVTCSR